MAEQKVKWVQTDKTCRFWGAFELPYDPAKPTLFLEIEPDTVFSFGGLLSKALQQHGNPSPFQTKGWRIRQQDVQKEAKHPEGKTFRTRKSAKQWVEWYYNKNAVDEKIVNDPAVQELLSK